LAESQHAQAQEPRFHISHPLDGVALLRPDVKNAPAFAGDGVTGGGEVEEELSIIEGDSPGCAGEEALYCLPQLFAEMRNSACWPFWEA
jgi:hypothetical protein